MTEIVRKNFAIIVGTDRPNSKTKLAANFIKEIGEARENVKVDLIDPGNYITNNSGQLVDPKFNEIIQACHAIIIVTPEYNHSYPGQLKILLDAEFLGYHYKPVGLVGVSSGIFGGVRVIESLLPVIKALKLIAISSDIQFNNVNEQFENDSISPKDEAYRVRVSKMYDELAALSEAIDKDKIVN
jgi:NAD(P)H-dependent FMN reductase